MKIKNPLYYGNKLFKAAEKVVNRVVFIPNKDMERQSFTGSLTPTRLSSAIKSADQGYMLNYFNICQIAAENDAHIASVVNTRKLEVSNLDWTIKPASQEPKDIGVAEFCTEIINDIPEFREHLKHLLNSIMYGISGNEIIWKNNGQVSVERLDNVRAQNFTFIDTLFPKLVMPPGNYNGMLIPPHKFIIHQADSISGLSNRAGVMRHVLIAYMFKSFSLKDWSIFNEVYGMPLRIGRYDASQEKEIDVIKDALAEIGSDASIVIPEGTNLEFLERKNTGSDPYKIFLVWLDQQISKAVLGQTLSTDAGKEGTVGANDQRQVRQDIKIDDAKNLGDTLKRDLLTPIVWFNFDQDTLIPFFEFDVKQKPDLNKLATRDSILTKDIGVPVAADYFYDTYGIPKPEDDQELVEPTGSGGFGDFKDNPTGLKEFSSMANDSYLRNNVCVFKAVNFLTDKYIKASTEAANITQQFFDNLKISILGVDDYDAAIKFIDGYKLEFGSDVLDFAENVNTNLNEIYEFGRKSVNPNAKPVSTFVDDLTGMSFNLIPENMLEFLRIQSFSVSHITHQKILESIRNLLINNRQSGLPYSGFRRSVDKLFNNTGYTKLNPFHLETIYIQNGQNAYHSGKLTELTSPEMVEAFPFWRYVTVGDDRVRPPHAAMNGFTARPNNSVWIEWYPPNGYRCRCDAEPVSVAEAEEIGIIDMSRPPKNPETRRPVTPDKGFSTNPSKLGVKFSNWFESNVSWKKVRNFYSLKGWSNKTAYELDISDDLSSQSRITQSNPDEIWGLFKNGNPVVILLKKFKDADGKDYFFKVEKSNKTITFENIVNDANAERIGVPLKTL